MEAQRWIYNLCSNKIISTVSKPKTSLCVIPCLSCTFSNSHKRVSFKAVHSLSQNPSAKRDKVNSATHVLEEVSSNENNSGALIKRKRLAVFVSGGGSNFRSIHEASLQQLILGDVVVLVTNKSDCGGAVYAESKGIPVFLFPKSKNEPDGLLPADIVAALRTFEVDFILLAGYLKMIPDELIKAYPRSILNIHPSLLPAFGGKGYHGMKVHKAVIASGARYSGPTIHFVDEHYDTGAILAQRAVPVLANDSAEDLASRVLQEEHNLYVDVVAALCEERVVWRLDGVPLIRSKTNPDQFS